MRQLIDFLFANPLILILVGTWVLGLIGKALAGAGARATKAAQELRERERRRLQQPVEEQKREAAEVKAEPQSRPRRLTQEEAMAEMRRILQGEPRTGDPTAAEVRDNQEEQRQQKRHRDAVAAEEQRQKRREVFATEGSRTADRKLGQVEIHVDPHVGEAMQQRRAPASGQVGHRAMGGLGGRALAQAAAISREQRGPVDLQDIKRLLIMREVLGPPLALRPDWGSGQPG